MTDLPASQGHTTILTVIDRFSKACRLIPLPKLSTALETAEVLCNYVFRFYGLSEDIVSDQGPQFTSCVWSAFCRQLNINVSLTSRYHPQANGQVERLNQELTNSTEVAICSGPSVPKTPSASQLQASPPSNAS